VAYVDVRDVALLHVAAVIDPELKSRRLYAWAHNYTWNDVVEVMRKLYPEKKFMDDFKDMKGSSARVDNEVSEALLKKWGQHGWTSLETCIKDTLEGKRPT
jgi:nucleoside-diphosphate-sugar epimerase